eukprot:jgi/Chlat1/114/Chrsp1S03088
MTASSSTGSHSSARSALLPAFARRNTTQPPAPHLSVAEVSTEVVEDAEVEQEEAAQAGDSEEGDDEVESEDEDEDEELVFPCEFCTQLQNASELDSHQRACRVDRVVSVYTAEVQLPCEFCNEPCAASLLEKHQSHCQQLQHDATAPSTVVQVDTDGNHDVGAPCDGHAVLPCEFCGESVLALEIVKHQRMCQEQLAVQDEALANALHEDSEGTSEDSVGSDIESEDARCEGGDQAGCSSEAWLVPCSFCGQQIEFTELIVTHAPACEKQQLEFAQKLEKEASDKEETSTDEHHRPPKIRRRHAALGGMKLPLKQPLRAHNIDSNIASTSACVTHVRQRSGVPLVRETSLVRVLPAASEIRLPFFQVFENVQSAKKEVWETMTRFLGQEPEFIDSQEDTACMRKRGWIHNLPREGRPPLPNARDVTIFAVLPKLATNWPQWDKRMKLNCFLSDIGCGAEAQRIVDEYESNGFNYISNESIATMHKKNLVWSQKLPHTLRTMKFTEIERVLGFPVNYTITIAITKQRARALGSTFAVPTLVRLLAPAAHKWRNAGLFPAGICVLSLFDGIGAAAIALHELGVKLRAYHTSEIDKDRERVVKNWFTAQHIEKAYIPHGAIHKGILATEAGVARLLQEHGPFDLVIGGSPCNDLSSANRKREGLSGEQSQLFHDYVRVVNLLRMLYTANGLCSPACE